MRSERRAADASARLLDNSPQRISDYELRLASRREALQREFTAADLAIKQLNNSVGQLSSLGAS